MSDEQQGLILPEPENRLALVIGVNCTPNAQTPLLKTELQASNDAIAMAQVLEECCGFKLLMPPLLESEATSANVKRAILQLARQRTEQDFLLLYFAGHGYPMTVSGDQDDIYLGTHDFNEQEVEEDEYAHCSMRWLRDKLYIPTNAGKVLIVLDCCYAGNIGRTAPDPYLEDLKARINTYFNAPGSASDSRPGVLRQALAATGHNQTAGEVSGHGRMTGLLLEALQGHVDELIDLENHGYITLLLVQNYLQRVMPEHQRPSLSGDDAGKICILTQYEHRAEELRQLRRTQVNEQPSSYIPFNRIISFQPRPGEFEMVTQLLIPDQSTGEQSSNIVGLVGIGGNGKTRLAVELAYTYKDAKRFPDGIFWLPVTEISQQGLARQLAGLAANALYLPPGDNVSHPENEVNRARHLCRYLVTHADALLILDNVDQIEEVLDLLPHFAGEALQCTILYTSRSEDAPSYVRLYKVEGLTEEGALRLLLEHRPELLMRVQTDPRSVEAQAAHEICQHVERLPLALTLLRDLLQDEHLTIELVWQKQQQRGTFGIISNEQDILKCRLFSAFEQSWQKVETDDAKRLFLFATSLPEAAPLPLWILSILVGLPGNNTSLDRLGQARHELQRWSLIEVLPNEAIRLHPLLREFGSRLLQDKANAPDLFVHANEQLTNEFMSINLLEQRARAKGYWNCLADVQEMLNYTHTLKLEGIKLLERIEYWLARDSSLLGDHTWWPDRFPGLFHQQLYNRAIEEGFSLPCNPVSDTPWLRQMQPAGVTEQLLLRELSHPEPVTSVAFSPDNHRLATGCENGIAYIWDVASGRMLQQLNGHTDIITKVAFSPDGCTLVTASRDGTARIWSKDKKHALLVFCEHRETILSAAFSPDGQHVATASEDGTTRIWDATTGQVIALLAQQSKMIDVRFSPNGQLLATHTRDKIRKNTLLIWNIEHDEIIATITLGYGMMDVVMAFSPDSGYILWRDRSSASLSFGDVTGRKISEELSVLTDQTSSKRSEISYGTYFTVLSPYSIWALHPHFAVLSSYAVELWQSQPRELRFKYVHSDVITDVVLSSDNTKVATVSFDRTARLWAIPSPSTPSQTSDTAQDIAIVHMCFSDDGSRLMRITKDMHIVLWEVTTGKLLWDVSPPLYLAGITDRKSIFQVLISLAILDTKRGVSHEAVEEEISLLKNHGIVVSSLAFSPDGKVMIASIMVEPSKYRMYVWHVDEKRLLGMLGELQDGIREIVYASDGQLVLTGPHESSVFIWDLHRYQCIGALPGHLGGITCISVSNDSMLVASGTLDGTIYLWSLQDGRKLATLRGHGHLIRCLSFSSDNSLLFSADRGGQALLWRIHAPLRPVLVGIYRTPHMLSAVHWQDTRKIVVADSGREQSAPHFYHLALEGDWDQKP